jgi:hypothetical protein
MRSAGSQLCISFETRIVSHVLEDASTKCFPFFPFVGKLLNEVDGGSNVSRCLSLDFGHGKNNKRHYPETKCSKLASNFMVYVSFKEQVDASVDLHDELDRLLDSFREGVEA